MKKILSQILKVLLGVIVVGATGFLLYLASIWALAGVIGFILIISLPLFFLIYYKLAPNNRFYTFVKEGTAKIIVKGDAFTGALISWKGRTFDDEWNVIPEGVWTYKGRVLIEGEDGNLYRESRAMQEVEEDGQKVRRMETELIEVASGDATPPRWEPRHIFGGLRFYSILHPIYDVLVYGFRWSSIRADGTIVHHPSQEEETGQGEKKEDKEMLDHVMLKDAVYYGQVMNAEDIKRMPLKVELILTMKIVNVRKAIFEGHDWLRIVINTISQVVVDAMTRNSYANLIANLQPIGEEITGVMKENGLIEEFRDNYGIELKRVGVLNIDPPKEYREMTTKQVEAEYDRDRILVESDAQAKKIEIIAKAESDRIDLVYGTIQKYKKLGLSIQTLEALKEGAKEGGKWIVAPTLSFLDDFLKSGDARNLLKGLRGRPVKRKTKNK